MSLYPPKLHLSPSLCLRLLCPLLLLAGSSRTQSGRDGGGVTPSFTTPTADCSTGCGSFGTDAAPKEHSDTSSTGVAPDFPPNNSSSTLDLKATSRTLNRPVTANESTADRVNQSEQLPAHVQSSTNTTTVKPSDSLASTLTGERAAEGGRSPTASPSGRLAHALTSVLPGNTTGSPAQSLHTGAITSTPSRTETTAGNVHSVSAPAPPATAATAAPAATTAPAATPATAATAATTATAAAPHGPTAVETTANASITVSTAYAADTPHLSAGVEPVQTSSSSPSAVTVASADASANKSKPFASATRVPVVEAAGAVLTRQLMDTASLLAVLLFGLLFFLVTVAVFVKQAYESYRRKDYTQVDYLINGMYSDSGV